MVTKEQKKQEIEKYIEDNYNKQDLVSISQYEIIKNLSDETFNKDYISDILDEMEREGVISTDKINLQIVYPYTKIKEIEGKYKKFIIPYNQVIHILIAYLINVIAISQFMPQYVSQAFLFPIFIFIAYFVILKISYLKVENIPFLKNIDSKYLLLMLSSIVAVGFIVFVYSTYI